MKQIIFISLQLIAPVYALVQEVLRKETGKGTDLMYYQRVHAGGSSRLFEIRIRDELNVRAREVS